MPAAKPVLSVRLSPGERALLADVAARDHSTISDYVRRKALEAAELEIMNRTVITIPAGDWERFEAWASQPPQDIPELRALASRPLPWKS